MSRIGSSSSIYTEGEVLFTAYMNPDKEITSWGYPAQYSPLWDHIVGPLKDSVSYANYGFQVTPPEDEEWDVKFEFQSNLMLPPGTGGVLVYFLDIPMYRSSDIFATSSVCYQDPDYETYYTPKITMTTTLTGGTYIPRFGVMERRIPYLSITGERWNANPFSKGPSTWLKATLIERRKK